MATTRKKGAATTGQGRNGRTAPPTEASHPNGASADTFFEALGESADALFTTSKASSERAYRLSQAAISDFQLAQRDLLRLAHKWAESPLDLLSWYTSVIETAMSAQGRVAAGARRWWEELAQARAEARDAIQRSARANWRAGRSAFGLASETFNASRRST
jgi:hypothetical protein